ncbi:GntR family transcriptional regulator [Novosphingobium cyanobacteriorum]|uniref:GntR family transcriptional regulator n=1 Tax=Novosphingobium cyanobacteriorum TaxID=3024215 RepID=A0ABT6CID7_9SPHN|nr:GntR family transcriptional regulator [Novosphingobium cyanobacteriorum]MDF8333048.1 GntR family transcriptional regulator [Novosphingobium cyanobacteriorum]
MASPLRPVYLRLRDRIAAGIIDGTWAAGALLPSVRTLAAEEGANPLTVAKAYQQFQDEGLVRVQRGIGLFVEPDAAETLRRREREQFLREEWPLVAERIRLLAIRPEDLPGLPLRADENV